MTHIFQHPAVAPEPNVGSAMAALLPQVPDALRAQMEQAYSDDLVFMFTTGMDAGEKVARDAIAAAQGREPAAVPSRPKLRLVLGGAR